MSPANDTFMSCSLDDTMRLWDLKTAHFTSKLLLKGVYLSSYDPTANVIAAASSYSHEVFLYDVRNIDKAPFSTFDLRAYYEHYIGPPETPNWTKLEFSNDGKHILIASATGGHMVVDSFTGQLKAICKRSAPSTRAVPGPDILTRPTGQGDVCFTPDGRFLIGGSGKPDGISVWNLSLLAGSTSTKVLEETVKLPNPDGVKEKAEVCLYNPRYNFIMSGDENLCMWYADPDLYAPI
jgi:COMPASS component SWD2